jgi:hypothetical protein
VQGMLAAGFAEFFKRQFIFEFFLVAFGKIAAFFAHLTAQFNKIIL